MKIKKSFVIGFATLLILGLMAFPSFGQTYETVYDTIGSLSTGVGADGITDFDGFQGTAGDTVSHRIHLTVASVSGATDSIFMYFPSGFGLDNVDTIAITQDPDQALDGFYKKTGSGGVDTLVFGGAQGTFGGDLDVTIDLTGIINDTTLFGPAGLLTDNTDNRFYVDTAFAVLKEDDYTVVDSVGIIIYLQAGAPDSFAVEAFGAAAGGTNNAQFDTAGAELDSIRVTIIDKYENILRDTVASVNIEGVYYNEASDSTAANAGKFIDTLSQVQYSSLTGSNYIVKGGDTLKVPGYGYTTSDTIKMKVSYGSTYGYGYTPTTVTTDRKASSSTKAGYSVAFAEVAADTPYVFNEMDAFETAPRGDMNPISVSVFDRFGNPNENDKVEIKRQLIAGQWYAYADSVEADIGVKTHEVTIDADGLARVYYASTSEVDEVDSLTITVIDAHPANADVPKSIFQQGFSITIVAGSVRIVTITPATANLTATDTSRYVSDASVADADTVKARAGQELVFLVRLWDQYENQKAVSAANYNKISIRALVDISGAVDTLKPATASEWSGGAEVDVGDDPDGLVDALKYTLTLNDTVSEETVPYRVWAWYDPGLTAADTIASDTTIFTTTGGVPSRVVSWFCGSGNLPTDTAEVASKANTATVRANLVDINGNIADTAYADTLEFSVTGDDLSGTPGFNDGASQLVLTRKVTAHKQTVGDSTVATAEVYADSAKGELTVTVELLGGTLTSGNTVAVQKLPLQIVSTMAAKTSTENSPATRTSATLEGLTTGFYSGSSRDILVWFYDEKGNAISPDTTQNDAIPKFNGLVGDGQFAQELDSLTISISGDDAVESSVTRSLWSPITKIMADTNHIRYTITAKSTEEGTDTVIVSWNSRLRDTLVVTTTLPSVLDHFIITVVSTPVFSDTSMGKAVAIVDNHSVKVEPRDAAENPIYSLDFESLNIELIAGSGETLPADTGSGFAADPATNPANILWSGGPPTLTDTSGGQALALESAFVDESATFLVNSSKSLKNVTAKVTMVDSNAATVTSTSVGTMRWYPMGLDTIEISTSGVVAEQTKFSMIITPKDIYKNIVEDTSYAVGITASTSGIDGIGNEIAVSGATPVPVTASATGTVNLFAAATKNLTSNQTVDVVGKGSITVSTATVNAPASLAATDAPDDAGGYVMLSFTASVNHPGMTGDTDAELPIDYYQVYRNATGSTLADAVNWATIPATPLIDASYSTIRAYVSTRGALSNAYYWVAAVVDGNYVNPSDESMAKAAAELGEGVVMGIEVEEAKCEALADAAVMTDDGKLISQASSGNKARPINNNAAASLSGADLNADKIVDILDIGIILDILDDAAEYDAVMDLNSDAVVDVFDIGRILDVFNTSVEKSSPTVAVNDGININSSVTMDNVTENSGEEFSLTVKAEQITGMAGYQFILVYDPALYEFVSVEEGEFLTAREGTSLFIHNDADGNLAVAGLLFDATDEITAEGEGVLATVKFKWIGDEATAITMNSIKIMDKSQKLNTIGDIVLEKPIALPDDFGLNQNYPNPFNPTTTIKYALPKSVHVDLTIYNILGQRIKTIVSDVQRAGYKKLTWDGTNDTNVKVASGIYIYRLKAGDFVSQKKMVFLK